MTLRCLCFVFIAGVMTGCVGGGSGASPEAALRSYARALREHRVGDAYAMMSEAYRRRVTREEFRRYFEDYPAEVRQTARALEEQRGEAQVEASVEYGEGESMRLAREAGTWRVVTDVVDFYDQSTPRSALRSFVRAMERRRYDVVLRLVPARDREGTTEEGVREALEGSGREEMERLLAYLREALDNPIEEVGDRATMSYGERFRVQFLREEGRWLIDDPD